MNKTILTIGIGAFLTIGISGCSGKKPNQLEFTTQAISINNALLDEKHTFVPKDAKLKLSNWAYEIESELHNDLFFENDAMVKVFLLAHNADRIIILGEGRVAKQYRNYFRNNGVEGMIDVQPIDMTDEYKNRVKIMFFSSKANYGDYIQAKPYKALPLTDEAYINLDSNLNLDSKQKIQEKDMTKINKPKYKKSAKTQNKTTQSKPITASAIQNDNKCEVKSSEIKNNDDKTTNETFEKETKEQEDKINE